MSSPQSKVCTVLVTKEERLVSFSVPFFKLVLNQLESSKNCYAIIIQPKLKGRKKSYAKLFGV